MKGVSQVPVLPAIRGTLQQVERFSAAEEDLSERAMVHKMLLSHRRSKTQQKQLHMASYVFPVCTSADSRKKSTGCVGGWFPSSVTLG